MKYIKLQIYQQKHFAMKIIRGINSTLNNVILGGEVRALIKLRICEKSSSVLPSIYFK